MRNGRDGCFEYVERLTPSNLGVILLTRRLIDKDYPLTGVVICFTSVQIEQRVRIGGQFGTKCGRLTVLQYRKQRLTCNLIA